jgi:hypothetical protein
MQRQRDVSLLALATLGNAIQQLKVLMKVGINFIHSAGMKDRERMPRVNIMLKMAPFPSYHPN